MEANTIPPEIGDRASALAAEIGQAFVARAVGFFVLGFVLAYAIYLAGGLDWLQAFLASRPPDYASAVIPPPPPLSSPATGIVTQLPPGDTLPASRA